jgi:hypothetical protein
MLVIRLQKIKYNQRAFKHNVSTSPYVGGENTHDNSGRLLGADLGQLDRADEQRRLARRGVAQREAAHGVDADAGPHAGHCGDVWRARAVRCQLDLLNLR